MIIFPAIDLKDGQCVRLLKGEMDQATVFNENPVDQAKLFESQGFEWIHIVDLNGAFSGQSEHTDIIKDIIQHTSIPIQLGGGIRHMDAIDHWLDTGLSRVILGTVALRDPDLVIKACQRHPGKIAVGIDGKDGYVAVEGWAETSEISVIELAKKFEEAGVSAIIYTDINRDGLLCGPDIEGTKTLAQSLSIPVIASGGVSSNDDIHAIKNLEHDGVCGVIVGRALYDGRIDITHALSTSKSTA